MKTKALENKTILVVDDEPDLRQIISAALKRAGANIHEARSGSEAFQIVKSMQIDAVISDIRMANGDGIELLDRIKETSVFNPLVLLVTGHSDLTLIDAYHQGAEGLFQKPFNMKEIIQTISRLLTTPEKRWDIRPETAALTVSGYPDKIEGRVVNLGRGGMFIATRIAIPLGVEVGFDIQMENYPNGSIQGKGIVKWHRSYETDSLPSGIGIELIELDTSCLQDVIKLIEKESKTPYIPKGPI